MIVWDITSLLHLNLLQYDCFFCLSGLCKHFSSLKYHMQRVIFNTTCKYITDYMQQRTMFLKRKTTALSICPVLSFTIKIPIYDCVRNMILTVLCLKMPLHNLVHMRFAFSCVQLAVEQSCCTAAVHKFYDCFW